jgi:hypothetical protein
MASNRSGERVTEEAPALSGPLPVLSTLPAVACRLTLQQNRRLHTMTDQTALDESITLRGIATVDVTTTVPIRS